MNSLQPNSDVYRGGIITHKVKNKGNWDIHLKTGEVVYDLDIDARKVKKGDWLVHKSNAASDYGRNPTWEILKADFVSEWMVNI